MKFLYLSLIAILGRILPLFVAGTFSYLREGYKLLADTGVKLKSVVLFVKLQSGKMLEMYRVHWSGKQWSGHHEPHTLLTQ